ncbi:hypothetical protein SAMN05421827_112159 [Pedobacter terrae]|uniref:Elongation factor Tu n=1 Tax=Pedobacter terrae TaxID=405671 RepID=A0A1G7Y047_9SPHI|nr:hypothetical protein [Pedobacter terrae]SDG89872.1 hypothetical protein SAMN05421827_112159 [Pedobacter terrae]
MMNIHKVIKNNELYLYQNGILIYKKWLATGESKVFDLMAYNKYTLVSFNEIEYENSNSLILVQAELELKPTNDGGRKSGIISGFRPNHVFEYKQNQMLQTFIGDINFSEWPTIEPGEKKNVKVRFLDFPLLHPYLNLGQVWHIHEGERVIGKAKILAFYDSDKEREQFPSKSIDQL